jgi:alpha-N-arabinofuranosidase
MACSALAAAILMGSWARGGESASITIDLGHSLGRVNPWVFGNNTLGYQKAAWQHTSPDYSNRGSGIWNPERRASEPALVALARGAGMSVSRWPGGCAVHRFDWKRTVGPLAERPDQQFGLPEFLRNCADIGAEPLVTVAEYFGTAADAADLVEYLNAPNDGRHRWAALRARDGHPAPWNVVWFEYGNESEHGDHHQQKMSAEEYARRYLDYRRAMRAVDPRVKLGAVIATGFPKLHVWARPVLAIVGRDADFVIHHSYLPQYGRNDGQPESKTLFQVALAETDQIQDYYDQMNALLRELTGKADMPIAVTEFNGSFVQEKPVPYRHTLGNSLVNAEMLRVFLRPQNHVVMANFWQFANEYWGAVKGYPYKSDTLVKRPQYYPFQLYREHFGVELLETTVRCGTYPTEGGFGVAVARGAGTRYKLLPDKVALAGPWQLGRVEGVTQRLDGQTLAIEFGPAAGDVNFFHASRRAPAEPGTGYRLSGWIKTEAVSSSRGVSLQIGDGRGWTVTRSTAATPDLTGTNDWTRVEVEYVSLADTNGLSIQVRRIGGTGPVLGRAWVRDVAVQKFIPQCFPAVPYLGVAASRSTDGKTVYLMVVNKHLEQSLRTKIDLAGAKPQSAQAWSLVGPAVDATNEKDPNAVHLVHRDLGRVENGCTVEFPPHSLSAVEIRVGRP